jgi:hypothetical protein
VLADFHLYSHHGWYGIFQLLGIDDVEVDIRILAEDYYLVVADVNDNSARMATNDSKIRYSLMEEEEEDVAVTTMPSSYMEFLADIPCYFLWAEEVDVKDVDRSSSHESVDDDAEEKTVGRHDGDLDSHNVMVHMEEVDMGYDDEDVYHSKAVFASEEERRRILLVVPVMIAMVSISYC